MGLMELDINHNLSSIVQLLFHPLGFEISFVCPENIFDFEMIVCTFD